MSSSDAMRTGAIPDPIDSFTNPDPVHQGRCDAVPVRVLPG